MPLLRDSSSTDHDAQQQAEVQHYLGKIEFRSRALEQHNSNAATTVDEVILLLQSGKHSRCNVQLIREAVRSALALRQHCVRCDFDITLVADDPIYSAIANAPKQQDSSSSLLIAGVFTRLIKSRHYATAADVFAAHKPRDLLLYSSKPFVLFLDADIVANDGTFPEALFDMLHRDQDLVLPIDWAHRHGPLWGRGLPGMCTCIVGFMNSPNVRRVLQSWQDVIERFHVDTDFRKQIIADLIPDSGQQFRDQELLSLVFLHHTFPDVKLHTLPMDWVCANQGHALGEWTEVAGSTDIAQLDGGGHGVDPSSSVSSATASVFPPDVQPVFRHKCRSLHRHSTALHHFDAYVLRSWLQQLDDKVGEPAQAGQPRVGCSGAQPHAA